MPRVCSARVALCPVLPPHGPTAPVVSSANSAPQSGTSTFPWPWRDSPRRAVRCLSFSAGRTRGTNRRLAQCHSARRHRRRRAAYGAVGWEFIAHLGAMIPMGSMSKSSPVNLAGDVRGVGQDLVISPRRRVHRSALVRRTVESVGMSRPSVGDPRASGDVLHEAAPTDGFSTADDAQVSEEGEQQTGMQVSHAVTLRATVEGSDGATRFTALVSIPAADPEGLAR